MDDNANSILARPKRIPWNKGKLTGSKPPLRGGFETRCQACSSSQAPGLLQIERVEVMHHDAASVSFLGRDALCIIARE